MSNINAYLIKVKILAFAVKRTHNFKISPLEDKCEWIISESTKAMKIESFPLDAILSKTFQLYE